MIINKIIYNFFNLLSREEEGRKKGSNTDFTKVNK